MGDRALARDQRGSAQVGEQTRRKPDLRGPGDQRPARPLSGVPNDPTASASTRIIDPDTLSRRERYHLITSLVVPRPIGWISTWDEGEGANLAPYSYFNAVSSSPMMVMVSVGRRRGGLKDTLKNLRSRGAFCVNVVTEPLLEAMNATSAEVGPEIDEFALAGLERARSDRVDAPFVVECPAVFECLVFKEVDLSPSKNVVVIGEVVGVRLADSLPTSEGTMLVDSSALAPVGRMSGAEYMLPRDVRVLPRP